MLYAFGFERVGVVVGDLYLVDPHPNRGGEGPEHGVRLELRVLERGALKGSVYSAQPIEIGQPIWRVDLLESVEGRPGSFDRTHHHPVFSGWNPNRRVFVRELSADPLGWLAAKLADLDDLVTAAGFPTDAAGPDDAEHLRQAAPEIIDVTRRLLDRVRAGELGHPPANAALAGTASASTAEASTAPASTAPASTAPAEIADDGAPPLIRVGWL